MPTAYVLINYDIGTEEKFRPEVMEVNKVNSFCDILVVSVFRFCVEKELSCN
jgi:hypothetical protein